ncbi:hypothetical protein BJP36_43290 [Moorena producens JHB]|uniref:Uncharacterized protein n=1 Tax=Moorena producens (strain JHB) TaxID=1454205 RepID=A0A9Q9ST64_MOOP1|nr:hypothetical protein [Moorena producens]WAN69188.1 hypothetical protein BJP36_43290 [Moorena producens JHB]
MYCSFFFPLGDRRSNPGGSINYQNHEVHSFFYSPYQSRKTILHKLLLNRLPGSALTVVELNSPRVAPLPTPQ